MKSDAILPGIQWQLKRIVRLLRELSIPFSAKVLSNQSEITIHPKNYRVQIKTSIESRNTSTTHYKHSVRRQQNMSLYVSATNCEIQYRLKGDIS